MLLRLSANIITVNPPPSPNGNADTSLQPPDIDMFFDTNAVTALTQLSKTIGHGLLKHEETVIQADGSLRARLTNLSQCEHQDIFDIPAEKCVKLRPTAFLGNILSVTKVAFSAVQLGQYLQFILGLEFPPQQTSNGDCICGLPNDRSKCAR